MGEKQEKVWVVVRSPRAHPIYDKPVKVLFPALEVDKIGSDESLPVMIAHKDHAPNQIKRLWPSFRAGPAAVWARSAANQTVQ